MQPTGWRRRGFTLVELLAAMVVIGVMASVATGVIYAAADSYASSAAQRGATERVSLAMDRIIREIRKAPSMEGSPGRPDIARAEAGAIEFGDGVRIELIDATLWLEAPGFDPSPLCSEVEAFELEYRGSDGVTDTMATPGGTQRINVRLQSAGAELRASALLRATLGGVS